MESWFLLSTTKQYCMSKLPIPQPDYFPAIRAYSKSEICMLLVDPNINTASPPSGFIPMQTSKLKRLIMGSKIGGEPMLQVLGFADERAYDCTRIFSPTQSELILRELL